MLAPYMYKMGGASEHVKKTVQYLAERNDIDLHVLTLGNKNELFKRDNLNICVLKKTLYPISMPPLIWSLRGKTIELNPNIIHAEGTAVPYSTVAALLSRRYPTLLTVMGIIVKEIQYHKGIRLIWSTFVNKTNEKYVLSKIPHIIVQSPRIKDFIAGMTNSKIHVVPEGIEYKKIRDINHYDSNEIIDIFIAVRFWKPKGIDILIRSIPEVIKFFPNLKVYIAGSGEEEKSYKNMVKDLGLGRYVTFLGYISNETEINRYYKSCKIVVVPSRWDVEPFAPMNAAASGKPAIVSDMCNSSIIEDGKTGFLFKSGDVHELSSKIVRLLTDENLRRDMGKAASEKAKEYDWSRIVEKKVEIYNEVVDSFYMEKIGDRNILP